MAANTATPSQISFIESLARQKFGDDFEAAKAAIVAGTPGFASTVGRQAERASTIRQLFAGASKTRASAAIEFLKTL